MKAAKLNVFSIILLALFVLSGCTATISSSSDAPSFSSNSHYKDIPSAKSQQKDLKFLTSDENSDTRSIGNEDGYYYVDRGNGIAANLRYIDYASKQDIFLSSRPDGNHHSPVDESYISSVLGSGLSFPVNNYLFLVRTGGPAYADAYGQDALAAVYRMNLDGANRTLLYSGSADETLLSTIATDGENLFLISRRTESENGKPIQNCYLIQIDMETGEKFDLYKLTPSTWMIGVADQCLVFHSIYVENESENTTPLMTHEIFVYSFNTETLSVIKTWPQAEQQTVKVYNNTLVTADIATRTLSIQNIVSGDIVASYDIDAYLPSSDTTLWFTACRDHKFMFWQTEEERMCVIDLNSGNANFVTLTYFDPDKLENRPVEIYAENQNQYLVCYDKKSLGRKYINADGFLEELTATQPFFALISKDDYWNSVPNYQKISFNE